MHRTNLTFKGTQCQATSDRGTLVSEDYKEKEWHASGYANRSLEGKSVIVTGASSGMGAEIARAMARETANVTIVARDAARLGETERDIAETGAAVTSVLVDITTDEAPRQIVDAAVESFGRIDVLVHNAGIFEPVPFEEMTLESLDRQWAVNVRAQFAITQAALPHMGKGSSVIVITSLAGKVGFPQSTAYCVTKGAQELFVRSLATELAPRGIRVNAVAPGNVHTGMNRQTYAADPEYMQRLIQRTPAKRIGEVTDIAPGVVFLASEGARFIYGATLAVDGGWTAQ